MSAKGINDKTRDSKYTIIDFKGNPLTDHRAKMIYQRYRTGKSIILEDLTYLLRHDIEGYHELAKYIITQVIGKEVKSESYDHYEIMIRKADNSNNQSKNLVYSSLSDVPVNSNQDISGIMASAKSKIEALSDQELSALLHSLNDETKLKCSIKRMKYWDDEVVDKMVVYTYEEEKTFNLLA